MIGSCVLSVTTAVGAGKLANMWRNKHPSHATKYEEGRFADRVSRDRENSDKSMRI